MTNRFSGLRENQKKREKRMYDRVGELEANSERGHGIVGGGGRREDVDWG